MKHLLQPLRALFALLALCLSASAFAQYPNRPLTLIVPWGAGGGTDAVARFIASLMEKDLASQSTWSTAPAARAWWAIRPSPRPRPTATPSA